MSNAEWHKFLENKGVEFGLTKREREVLTAYLPSPEKSTNSLPAIKDVKASLNIAESTCKEHLKKIYDKFSVGKGCEELRNITKSAHKRQPLLKCLMQEFRELRPEEFEDLAEEMNSKQVGEIVKLLSGFDYQPHASEFAGLSKQLAPVGAFLVRAEEEIIQRWLVHRLAGEISGFRPGTEIIIDIHLTRIRSNFELLWTFLGAKLEVSSDRKTVLHCLCERSRTGTIVIVLFGVRKLQDKDRQAFCDFWRDLVSEICRRQIEPIKKGLFLFLTDDKVDEDYPNIPPFQFAVKSDLSDCRNPIVLEPLKKIEPYQTKLWMERDSQICDKLLPKFLASAGMNFETYISNIDGWGQDPWTVINNICESFGCKEGINNLEPYWRQTA